MLKKMRETIERHVCESENIMFDQAKDVLLCRLKDLKVCPIFLNLNEDVVKKRKESAVLHIHRKLILN